jgi:hypothetical protein
MLAERRGPAAGKHRGRLLLLVVGALVFLGVVTFAIFWTTRASEVSISSPANGDRVESLVKARGTASIRAGSSLWLLLKPVSEKSYYLTDTVPVEVAEDGEWASPLIVGEEADDVGAEFYLIALVAPDGGMVDKAFSNRPAGQWSAHFASIPSDSVVADRVRIQLGRFVDHSL